MKNRYISPIKQNKPIKYGDIVLLRTKVNKENWYLISTSIFERDTKCINQNNLTQNTHFYQCLYTVIPKITNLISSQAESTLCKVLYPFKSND